MKRGELRLRAEFSVCQAISIAITVVLPAPVASLKAMRRRSGLASALRARSRSSSCFGATSVSQMAVSAASIWQKKRRRWRAGSRQCWSRRAVTGVTVERRPAEPRARQAATFDRISLM